MISESTSIEEKLSTHSFKLLFNGGEPSCTARKRFRKVHFITKYSDLKRAGASSDRIGTVRFPTSFQKKTGSNDFAAGTVQMDVP